MLSNYKICQRIIEFVHYPVNSSFIARNENMANNFEFKLNSPMQPQRDGDQQKAQIREILLMKLVVPWHQLS